MSKRCIKKDKPLTTKELLFCKHYLANGFRKNRAAIAAGFSEKSANCIGHFLCEKPNIKKYINDHIKKVAKKLDMQFEDKLKLLWSAAQRCYGVSDEDLDRFKNGEEVKALFKFDPEGLVKLVAEMNKMQGDYAQPKAPDDSEQDQEKLDEEIKKYEREC